MRELRASAQLLHRPPGGSPLQIVRHLLVAQAQDARATPLALRARGTGFGASAVAAALQEGSLVVCWLMRGTLHLVAREDHGWLLALTAPGRRAANARRLRQLGVDEAAAERAVGVIEAALPCTRPELAHRLGSAGQQTPHLLMRAALDGVCVLGDDRMVVPAPRAAPPPSDALGALGRRYLAAHAPADAADLAAWSGLGLRAARTALAAAGPATAPAPEPLARRLLPAFDEYLLGWKDRSFAVPGALAQAVHPGGGMIRATAVDATGTVVGTWSGSEAPPPGFEAEAADVERFLGS